MRIKSLFLNASASCWGSGPFCWAKFIILDPEHSHGYTSPAEWHSDLACCRREAGMDRDFRDIATDAPDAQIHMLGSASAGGSSICPALHARTQRSGAASPSLIFEPSKSLRQNPARFSLTR